MINARFYSLIESLMPSARKTRVRRKAKKAICVRRDCDKPQKKGCRGLCKKHWNQFDYARRLAKKQGEEALEKFEADEFAAGRVMKSRKRCGCKNDYKARVIGATT